MNEYLYNNQEPLLIAEVSANHDKSLSQLILLIELAHSSGWNCVKLQTYTADSLSVKTNHKSTKVGKEWGGGSLYDLYERAAMPMEFHQPAFERIRELGMFALTSIYDPRDLDFLEKLQCSAYKVASFELTYLDLLRAIADTGKDLILSTGMASLDEIKTSVDIIKSKNPETNITLMHCISTYPTPVEIVNLSAIKTLRDTFKVNVGFSDHTLGSEAAILAYTLGATMIEKHITNNKRREGPDHRFSAEPQIFIEIAKGIKRVKTLSGSGKKGTLKSEEANKKLGRRSAFTTKIINKGEKISQDNFRFVRPEVGIPADVNQQLIGKTLNKRLAKGVPITWDDLE